MTGLNDILKQTVPVEAQVPPPMAIVVMVVPVSALGEAGIQVQWPPQMPLPSVAQALQAALGTVKAMHRTQTGGLILPEQNG